MKRKNTFYSSKVKLEAIRFIKEDHFVKEIQKILNIKSEPQVYTWWYWYRDGELERFSQPIGKQYPYGHGPKGATPKETLKIKNKILYIESGFCIHLKSLSNFIHPYNTTQTQAKLGFMSRYSIVNHKSQLNLFKRVPPSGITPYILSFLYINS